MKTIFKEKLSEQAYRILREMITDCRFLPGSRLNIEQLSRDMEISRTPLWEAVNRLIQEGLLISVPNRGVFVADITPEAALEIYTVRGVLEGLAARLAAGNVHPEAVARMESSLARQFEMAERQDLIGYSRYDFEFHDVVYELSQNKFLQELLDFVRARTRPTLMDFVPLLKTSYEDHRAILESLKAGDGARAEKTIRTHVGRICRQLKKTASKGQRDRRPGALAPGSPGAGAALSDIALVEKNSMSEHIEHIRKAVVDGKHAEIEKMVQQAADDKTDLNILINEALIGAMDIVGRRFGAGEIFVPEMLVSALTMKKGLALIKPLLIGAGVQSRGFVLIGTVRGDLHDIGKNLVTMMLEGSGFKVLDLGVDLSVEKAVSKVEELKPDILALSALLTTTMPEMEKVIRALESKGLRGNVKIMVGGAPVDEKFAGKIGADGYGKDAGAAVQLAKDFLHLN